uniref:C-type lectin domain-containing protein n=1 Tax=Cyprinus carpio TaxID=7962 RepID=A0A8C2EF03_CYPCA
MSELHLEIETFLKDKDKLVNDNNKMTKQNQQLAEEEKLLSKHLREMAVISKFQFRLATNLVVLPDGWMCSESGLYYISSEKKNWTDSREDCLNRGANLTIINSKEEQDFFKTYDEVWIGLTNMNGRWKWTDDSTLTSSFWASGEPNGLTNKDCAVTSKNLGKSEWYDYPCSSAFKWICERKPS